MRLIDADALKNVIYESWGGDPAYHTARRNCLKTETDVRAEEACLMLENIDAQPTIEAEPNSCEYWDSESRFCALRRPQAKPIKRGKPVVYYHGENTFSYECSVCRMPIDRKDYYCRWCGAKLYGGKEND